jgi:putative endonuclease
VPEKRSVRSESVTESALTAPVRSGDEPYGAAVSPDPRRGIGRRGETVAAKALERLGYTILDRNFRTREGELDLIASSDGTLVFCEVKALVARPGGPSAGPVSPLEAVGPAKRVQVRRMARAWLAARGSPGARDLRFDVIGVLLSPAGELLRLDHAEGAF